MESFPIDKLVNAGVPLTIAGKEYLVTQFTLRDQGRLQAVIRKLEPNPLDVATKAMRGLASDVAAQVIKDARKDAMFWPSPITSDTGLAILFNHEEGQKEVLKAALSRAQECTDADIEAIMDRLTYMDFMKLAAVALSGEIPEQDPKA